ncbi:MAG: PEP-CTERM sorting domain-containing protein [Acidobacteriota bacterium]
MKLQHIAAAVALATAGVAHASLDDMTGGNSSVAFIAIDNVGTTVGSVFVDLGVNLTDFAPVQGEFSAPFDTNNLSRADKKVVWNFNNSTITVNGVTKAANNDFSAFSSFVAGTDDTTKWGVIAGDSLSGFQRMLTTGTPSATALSQQNGSATSGMILVNSMWQNAGVSALADNSSYYANNAGDNSYVAKTSNFSTNWQNKLKWASLTTNAQNNFWMAVGEGSEYRVGDITNPAYNAPSGYDTTGLLNGAGTFTFDKAAGTLTWSTATTIPAVPEPESFALALVGLAAAGFVARRRAAK